MNTTAATVLICTIFCALFGASQLVHIFGDNQVMMETLRNLALLFGIPTIPMLLFYIKKTAQLTATPA